MGPNDKEDISSTKPTSILAKIGNAVSGMGGFLGRGGEALGYGIIYPIQPKNWFKSFGEIRHDIKNGWNYVIGNPTEEYDPPIETTQASKNLGIEIISYKDGKIKFLASRTLTGDIPYLTPEQLGKMEELNKENKYSSIAIFKEENKVVIEVDVGEITKKIKNASENKGKSSEEIKGLVLKGIYNEVDRNLKGLAGIIGGELERHTDRKLLNGIAEKLYREYDGQNKSAETAKSLEQSSEAAVPKKPLNTIEPNNEIITQNNMTNPLLAYYQEVADGKMSGVKFPSKEQQDILGKLGSGLSNPEDASDKQKKPLSTPTVEGNEKGGRRF
ncbi:MAG: hypothetical protein ACR5K9_05940 [Wolbachia sp.]